MSLRKCLNDESTTQEWHSAKILEYKEHSPAAPREKLWFIYKLLGSVISNSSSIARHWVVHARVVAKMKSGSKKKRKEPELSSQASPPDEEAAHLFRTISATVIWWSSFHCKIKAMPRTDQPFKRVRLFARFEVTLRFDARASDESQSSTNAFLCKNVCWNISWRVPLCRLLFSGMACYSLLRVSLMMSPKNQ